MDEPSTSPAPEEPFEKPRFADHVEAASPRKKGFTVLSWLVILALAGLVVGRTFFDASEGHAAQEDRLRLILFEMQSRYLVGAANAVPVERDKVYEQATPLDAGSNEQRLRFVAVAGELAGPREALDKAAELKLHLQRGVQQRVGLILENIYRDYLAGDYRASSLTKDDRQLLHGHLGWFGDLALNPRVENPRPAGWGAPAGAAAAIFLEQPAPDLEEREHVLAPALATFTALIVLTFIICFRSVFGMVLWDRHSGTYCRDIHTG